MDKLIQEFNYLSNLLELGIIGPKVPEPSLKNTGWKSIKGLIVKKMFLDNEIVIIR